MAQTILADMDTWKRIAGSADDDGAFTVMVLDKDAKSLLQQVLTALARVSARLDAGIKVQTLAVGATVPATV